MSGRAKLCRPEKTRRRVRAAWTAPRTRDDHGVHRGRRRSCCRRGRRACRSAHALRRLDRPARREQDHALGAAQEPPHYQAAQDERAPDAIATDDPGPVSTASTRRGEPHARDDPAHAVEVVALHGLQSGAYAEVGKTTSIETPSTTMPPVKSRRSPRRRDGKQHPGEQGHDRRRDDEHAQDQDGSAEGRSEGLAATGRVRVGEHLREPGREAVNTRLNTIVNVNITAHVPNPGSRDDVEVGRQDEQRQRIQPRAPRSARVAR